MIYWIQITLIYFTAALCFWNKLFFISLPTSLLPSFLPIGCPSCVWDDHDSVWSSLKPPRDFLTSLQKAGQSMTSPLLLLSPPPKLIASWFHDFFLFLLCFFFIKQTFRIKLHFKRKFNLTFSSLVRKSTAFLWSWYWVTFCRGTSRKLATVISPISSIYVCTKPQKVVIDFRINHSAATHGCKKFVVAPSSKWRRRTLKACSDVGFCPFYSGVCACLV